MRGEAKGDEFVKELDAAVGKVITAEEWRLSYVKLSILRQEWQNEAREEGRVEGRAKGEGKFAALVKKLISEGKSDAIEKVTDDKNFRRELYDLYGIN